MSNFDDQLAESLETMEGPVLVVSTKVGRGMYSIGEAVAERLQGRTEVRHVGIEDFLPERAVQEDLKRYQFISNNFKFLLNLVYKIPFFYWRKYVRESARGAGDLKQLRELIDSTGTKTVICISHRPAFWVSKLKQKDHLSFSLFGLLGEYGKNLGWKYIFWNQMNGYLSPVTREEVGFPLPPHVQFKSIKLPARSAYEQLAKSNHDAKDVLVICGYWGQGDFMPLVKGVRSAVPDLRCHVVCGENERAYRQLLELAKTDPKLEVRGLVDSLVPLLEKSAIVVTKPGISTLIEAHAAQRKIFMIPGMPIAEANNANYAQKHFAAEWFTREALSRYYRSHFTIRRVA